METDERRTPIRRCFSSLFVFVDEGYQSSLWKAEMLKSGSPAFHVEEKVVSPVGIEGRVFLEASLKVGDFANDDERLGRKSC